MTVDWAGKELRRSFPWLIKCESVKPSAFTAEVSRFASQVRKMKAVKIEDCDEPKESGETVCEPWVFVLCLTYFQPEDQHGVHEDTRMNEQVVCGFIAPIGYI